MRRFVAYWVDNVIVGIGMMIVFVILAALMEPTLFIFLPLYLLGFAYFGYFWGMMGTSPGKRLMHLRIYTLDGKTPIGIPKAIVRFCILHVVLALIIFSIMFFLVMSLLGSMGFVDYSPKFINLSKLFKSVSLHDSLMRTIVVKE